MAISQHYWLPVSRPWHLYTAAYSITLQYIIRFLGDSIWSEFGWHLDICPNDDREGKGFVSGCLDA